MEGFYSQKVKKSGFFFFQERLPSFRGQKASIRLIPSLALTLKPGRLAEITFPGKAEASPRLGIKSQFGDVGLSTIDILDLLSLFLTGISK